MLPTKPAMDLGLSDPVESLTLEGGDPMGQPNTPMVRIPALSTLASLLLCYPDLIVASTLTNEDICGTRTDTTGTGRSASMSLHRRAMLVVCYRVKFHDTSQTYSEL